MDIKIKVIPKSSSNTIVGFELDLLKVKLTAVPENGLANKALINLLSKELKIPKSSITILKGKSLPLKIVRIDGILKEDLCKYKVNKT